MTIEGPTRSLAGLRGLISTRRFVEAERMARDLLAVDPQSSAMGYLVQALSGQGRVSEAVQAARTFAAARPDDDWALRLLATTLSTAGAQRRAIAVARDAVALAPDSVATHVALALCLLRGDRTADASGAATTATGLDPSSVDAWLLLGEARVKSGSLGAAEDAYLRALSLDPERSDALNNLGTIYLRQGKRSSALDLFERAARANARSGLPRANIVRASRTPAQQLQARLFLVRAGVVGLAAWLSALLNERHGHVGLASLLLIPLAALVGLSRVRPFSVDGLSPAAAQVVRDAGWRRRLSGRDLLQRLGGWIRRPRAIAWLASGALIFALQLWAGGELGRTLVWTALWLLLSCYLFPTIYGLAHLWRERHRRA